MKKLILTTAKSQESNVDFLSINVLFREAEHPGTVYKTVDFIKTEAFNRTKKNVEEKRYNIQK